MLSGETLSHFRAFYVRKSTVQSGYFNVIGINRSGAMVHMGGPYGKTYAEQHRLLLIKRRLQYLQAIERTVK